MRVPYTHLSLPRHEVGDVRYEEGLSSAAGLWNWKKQPPYCFLPLPDFPTPPGLWLRCVKSYPDQMLQGLYRKVDLSLLGLVLASLVSQISVRLCLLWLEGYQGLGDCLSLD
jgi:hypothetical protein